MTSLFAGIGGFDLAFKRRGVKVVCSVEKNANCRAILRRHFPKTLLLDDVCTAGRDDIPDSDIITFGWPCQDLSTAGLRKGFKGDRSVLFFEALRITDEKRPSFVVFENVPGLLSSCSCRECGRRCADCHEIAGAEDEQCASCGSEKIRGRVLPSHRGADLYAVVSSLNIIGYSGAWTLLDARYFGVPQRRQRLFGVFTRLDSGARRCGEILSLVSRLQWNPDSRGQEGKAIAGTLTHSARKGSPHGGDTSCLVAGTLGGRSRCPGADEAKQGLLVARTITAGNGHAPISDGVPANLVTGTVSAKWKKGTGGPAGDECQNLVTDTFTAAAGRSGGVVGQSVVPVNLAQITSKENRSQPKPGDPSPTMDTEGRIAVAGALRSHPRPGSDTIGGTVAVRLGNTSANGAGVSDVAHALGGSLTAVNDAVAVRRLTPRETERLQGYEDDWTAWGRSEKRGRIVMADTVRYEMTGNSVAVPCVDWIAGKLIDEIRRSETES